MGGFFQQRSHELLWLTGSLWLCLLGTTSTANGQIVFDETLPTNSVLTHKGNTSIIEGGTRSGQNLFHSFQEFSVPTGAEAFFNNALDIKNILSRVTGGNISNIDGLIRTNGTANLFLINPNGIIFGPNASLDIRGSLVATTADGIQLGKNGFFSATQPQTSTLLSVKPGALFFNQMASQQAAITNAGNLSVGRNLTLAAGNLDLQGQLSAGGNLTLSAYNTVQIHDSIANPFIADAGGNLLVQGSQAVDIFALNHPDSHLSSTRNMVLRSANPIGSDGRFSAGGNLRVEHLDGSLGDLVSPNDPVFQFGSDVSFGNYTGGSLQILAGGSITAGTITITGAGTPFNNSSLTLSDRTPLTINGTTRPTLDIRAGTTTFFATPTPVAGLPTTTNIRINQITFDNTAAAANGLIFLTNQFSPNTGLPSGTIQVGAITIRNTIGNAGSVVIDSRGGINLTGDLNAWSTGTASNGGNIYLIANGQIITTKIDAYSDNGNAGQINLTSRNGGIDTTRGILDTSTGTIAANGGDITLQASSNIATSRMRSDGGRLGGSGQIALTSDAGTVSIANGYIYSPTYGTGKGGDIRITAQSVSLNHSLLDATTFGSADGGHVIINAPGTVSIDRGSSIYSLVGSGAVGNSGGIIINTGSLSVTKNAELNSSVTSGGQGKAGDVTINARDTVTFDGGFVFSRLEEGGVGQGGNIRINTGSLVLTGIPKATADANIGQLVAFSAGQGNGGNVIVNARDTVTLDGKGSDIWTLLGGASDLDRKAGNITINTRSLSISNNARLIATNESSGSDLGRGNAGNITISAESVSMSNNGQLSAASSSPGKAGDITINTESLSMSSSAIGNSQINSAQGPGGNITINTDSFSARDGSQLNAQTETTANAGNILIQARDSFSLDDSRVASSVEAGAGGQGGDIDIKVTNGSVSLTNGAQLVASTAGKGDAGSVRITASENLSVNNSSVSSAVEAGAVGNGGDVNINTRSLSLTNGAQLSASTAGQGSPGNISVRDAQSVSLDNHSAISTAVESSAVVPTNAGNAVGTIEIETDTLQLGNGANITASTRGQGNAGSVTVTASKSVSLDNSSATTAVESGGKGNGGDLNINTRSLSLTNDAQISASTAGEGSAGNITITTDELSVSDRSQVAVSSTGEGKAGELEVNASDIFLNNQGKLIASTASGEGGNIRLNADNLLLMRRNSLISAEAQNNGNGGNIDINTRFAIAIPSENSDIIANANQGKGGNIQITAQGVFGLQLRDKLTPFSDITASSQFGLDGVVVINILNVDPSRGLVQLPENLSDPSQQIATGCAVAKGNSFAVTGRGGLSEDPTQTLNGRTVWQDLRVTSSRPGTLAQTPIPQFQPSAQNQQPTPLVEATGWVMNAKGQVELVARAPQVTPNSPWSRPADCQTINAPQ